MVDRAAFHTSAKVHTPKGVHLFYLPPNSPELQLAKRLWLLTNEAIANRSFADLKELEAVTAHCCWVLLQRTDFIQGLTKLLLVGRGGRLTMAN
ncbi:MAG: transposase [Cyanobacteria bacterium]|nr:transposase [Cyanobacteriota bacterium]MDW8200735.1 transposase [Cyanobacteriota bacterium SKYGB_h_bin112]